MRRVTDGMAPLWQAVLLRAVMDGLGQGSIDKGPYRASHMDHAQREADAWLTRAGRDMQHVCALAGFDPDAVRDGYLRARDLQRATGARVYFGNGVRLIGPDARYVGRAA
jgi:hypothetical protein